MTMRVTCDPAVFIEAESAGSVTYRRTTDGRRWKVRGVCDYRGDCMVGAVEPWPPMRREDRLDVPVTPELGQACCPFTYVELEPA